MARKKKPIWSRKIVALMCSPVFFVASCTGGALLGAGPLESIGGRDMERGERPDMRMMVVATVPDPARPGGHRVEQVMLASLPRFKESNPEYSLIPPQPEGRIENVFAEMVTDYKVLPSAEGTVVETRFQHEMLSVRARYVATRSEVKPLYTNSGSAFGALLLGVGLACVLGLVGRAMKYFIQYRDARGL
jgi:hypothetical protein